MEELKNAIDEIIKQEIIKLVISNKMNADVQYYKITFVLKEDDVKQYYQIEKCTDKQVFHENIEIDILGKKVFEYVSANYKQVDAWSNTTTFELKISKKGKVHLGMKKSDNVKLVIRHIIKKKTTFLKRV